MPHQFNAPAWRIFKAVTKLVDFWDEAVQKWLQFFRRKPKDSLMQEKPVGPSDEDSMKAEGIPHDDGSKVFLP